MKIICITLKEHKAKTREHICNQLSRYVTDINNHELHLLAVNPHPTNGKVGCFESHLKALKMLGNEPGLILEQDCLFTRPVHLADIATKYKNEKVVWLGYNAFDATADEMDDSHIILKHAMCLHCILVLRPCEVFPLIDSFHPNNNHGIVNPIDVVYSKLQPAFGLYPIVAIQDAGWSTSEMRHTDYRKTMISRSEFFWNLMPPSEISVIFLPKYTVEEQFKLRRLPIVKVFPNMTFNRVILCVDMHKLPDEWDEYYKKNKLAAFFRTRQFKVAMFSGSIWAMSREYYNAYSPYVVVDPTRIVNHVDMFYPPFDSKHTMVFNRDDMENQDKSIVESYNNVNWIGHDGYRSQPLIMMIYHNKEHENMCLQLAPYFYAPYLLGLDDMIIRVPKPDIIITFEHHPFYAIICEPHMKVIIISKNDFIQLPQCYRHLVSQISIIKIDWKTMSANEIYTHINVGLKQIHNHEI